MNEHLGLLQVLHVVENTPFIDSRLLKHLVPVQVDLQVSARLINRKLDSLSNLLQLRVDTPFSRLLSLMPHQDIPSVKLCPLKRNTLILHKEAPVLHSLNTLGVAHDLLDKPHCLLYLDRSIPILSHCDLSVNFLLFTQSLCHSHSQTKLRQKEAVATDE